MIKYFTWYMKTRKKVDTIRGVDEHEDFKSRQWEVNGNRYYNFWNLDDDHPATAVNYKVREEA
jgi:predicted transcriptional regulator